MLWWKCGLITAAAATVPTAMARTAGYSQQPVSSWALPPASRRTIVAGTFADQTAKSLGQPFIVENKPGANAVLATEAVASAKPDALALLAAATNHTLIPALYTGRIKFDAAKSFAPVCTLASSTTVPVVGPSLAVKSVPTFLERSRAKPGTATYVAPGLGSSPHVATETFRKLVSESMVHVRYKGAAPAGTHLTPASALGAAKLIRTGELIELGHVLRSSIPLVGTRRFDLDTKRSGPSAQLSLPAHQIMLVLDGIHLLENLKLDALATKGVHESARRVPLLDQSVRTDVHARCLQRHHDQLPVRHQLARTTA